MPVYRRVSYICAAYVLCICCASIRTGFLYRRIYYYVLRDASPTPFHFRIIHRSSPTLFATYERGVAMLPPPPHGGTADSPTTAAAAPVCAPFRPAVNCPRSSGSITGSMRDDLFGTVLPLMAAAEACTTSQAGRHRALRESAGCSEEWRCILLSVTPANGQ